MSGPPLIPNSVVVYPDGLMSVHWRGGVGRHRDVVSDISELPRIQALRALHGLPPLVPVDQPLEAS